eukprot:154373-Chlamydomonas_euryale.AAC.3
MHATCLLCCRCMLPVRSVAEPCYMRGQMQACYHASPCAGSSRVAVPCFHTKYAVSGSQSSSSGKPLCRNSAGTAGGAAQAWRAAAS